MSGTAAQNAIAVVGVDIGKNSFHVVGLDDRGAIVLRQKWSRSQVEARFANMPPCLIGMEACVGAHHLSRKLKAFGHDARLMPAKYVRPYSKGQKNDFRDAEAIAEAVQRPTMKFVTTKTADQLDLQALHRVRERLVSQRTGIINQIRAFLLERGIAVRQGQRFLRTELPRILATPPEVLSPRMARAIEGLAGDWRWLDQRIEELSNEIEELARRDPACVRLMSVPGIGPIISDREDAGPMLDVTVNREVASSYGILPATIDNILDDAFGQRISTTGAVPLMLGTGVGSELRQPLGYTIVGGLAVSQLLTLFTTPVVYIYLDRLNAYLKCKGRKLSKKPAAKPAVRS